MSRTWGSSPSGRGPVRPQRTMPVSLSRMDGSCTEARLDRQRPAGRSRQPHADQIPSCVPAPCWLPPSFPCSARRQHKGNRHIIFTNTYFFIVSILWNTIPAYCPYQEVRLPPLRQSVPVRNRPRWSFCLPPQANRGCPDHRDAALPRHKGTKRPAAGHPDRPLPTILTKENDMMYLRLHENGPEFPHRP